MALAESAIPIPARKNGMISTLFLQRSLKMRVTLFTLGLFVFSLWALSFYASRTLREDMQKLLSDQQSSTVSLVAQNINDALAGRLNTLQTIAAEIKPELLQDPTAVQALLEQHPILQQLFSRGSFVIRNDGVAIAQSPSVAGRFGPQFSTREYVMLTLKEGRPTIGKPITGNDINDPGIAFTAPLRDKQGKTVGVLVGVAQSEQATLLDKISENRYGKISEYLLLAQQYRQVITTTTKEIPSIKTLPAAGINPLLDRFIQGYEGSDVFVNPAGVEVLASAKRIPIAGWSVVAMLPTEEAFAPVRKMQQRALLAALFLTLLAGGLTWWVLRRELAPLRDTAKSLVALSKSDQVPNPLRIFRQDEIGDLIGGFNLLLNTLALREAMLRDNGSSLRTLPPEIRDIVWLKDEYGVFLSCNQRFERLFGALEKDIVGKTDYDFVDKEQADFFRANDLIAFEKGESSVNEECVRFADDGHYEVLKTIKTPLFDSNRRLIGVLGIGYPSSTVGAREHRFSKGNSTSLGGFKAFFENHE